MHFPTSCDTFVVLPPLTKHGVVFGKNSDRPKGEVQEVVYLPASESTDPIKVLKMIYGFNHNRQEICSFTAYRYFSDYLLRVPQTIS